MEFHDSPHLSGQGHRVRDHDHRDALFPVQLNEQFPNGFGRGTIKGSGWFIREQQGRLINQRTHDRHALLLAT